VLVEVDRVDDLVLLRDLVADCDALLVDWSSISPLSHAYTIRRSNQTRSIPSE